MNSVNRIANYSQNHSFHSDCECNSGANLEKNSVIFSCFPDANAVTKYNFNKPDSNFLTAGWRKHTNVKDLLREIASGALFTCGEWVLQFAEQMPIQMVPNIPKWLQIMWIYWVRYLVNDFVHAKTFVFVRFQL